MVNKKVIICLLIYIFLSVSSLAADIALRVSILETDTPISNKAGIYPIKIVCGIPKGWFIHAHGKGINSTRISFNLPEGVNIRELVFPQPKLIRLPFSPEPLPLYSDLFSIDAKLQIFKDLPYRDMEIEGVIHFQACKSNLCLPPKEQKFKIRISLSSQVKRFRGKGLFATFITLLGIFLGGMGLNLTPCIYPMIPITISYFGGRDKGGRKDLIIGAFLYLMGISITNSSLALVSSMTRTLLGFSLSNPWIILSVSGIIFIFSLSMFDIWQFKVPSVLLRLASRSHGGILSPFIMGMGLGVVAAPCIGPFILSLITYVSQLGDPFRGFLYLFVFSIGLGFPLSVLSVFSGYITRLPSSGEWMVWIRRLFGWILIFMSIYILRPIFPMIFWRLLLLGVGISASIYLGIINRKEMDGGHLKYIRWIISLSILVLVVSYLIHQAIVLKRPTIQWISYDGKILDNALRSGRPAIVDFYADWCGPCRYMDEHIFKDPEILRYMDNLLAIRVDITKGTSRFKEVIDRYDIKGVPTLIFLDSKGEERRDLRIESIISKEEFLKRLKFLLNRVRALNFSKLSEKSCNYELF